MQKHPGMGAVDACPFLQDVLQKALFAPDVMGSQAAELAQREAIRSEARTLLKAMGNGVQGLWAQAEDLATFHFPAAAGPTPAGDCCKQPDHRCPFDPADWAAPTWQTLGFQAYDPTYYRYSFRPTALARRRRSRSARREIPPAPASARCGR